MKYYKSKEKSKTTVLLRVLIVLAILTAVFILTVLFGNHLLNKVQNLADPQNSVGRDPDSPSARPTKDEDSSYAPKVAASDSEVTHRVATVSLLDFEKEEDVLAAVDAAKKDGFDAVSFVVRDGSFRLAFASEYLTRVYGVTFDASVPDAAYLSRVTAYLHENGMTASALFTVSNPAVPSDVTVPGLETDTALVAELAAAGFDEVLLDGYFAGETPTLEAFEAFLTYLRAFREKAPDTYFGTVLTREVFRVVTFAPKLDKLYRYTDCLLLDLRGETEPEPTSEPVDADGTEEPTKTAEPTAEPTGTTEPEPTSVPTIRTSPLIEEITTTMMGSLSLYNLRVLYAGTEAQRTSLTDHAIGNYQTADYQPPRPETPTDAPITEETPDVTSEPTR